VNKILSDANRQDKPETIMGVLKNLIKIETNE